MPVYQINQTRWPDEFRYALNSITKNFPKNAELTDDFRTIKFSGLSPAQVLAYDIFQLVSEVDEVIENLNMSLSDMEALGKDARTFQDRNPFNRFQFLFRMFFYEYGRFEDIFAHFTQWKLKFGLLTKEKRKTDRQAFYDLYEYAIKTRNVMMHDSVSWHAECSPELAILQGLELIGKAAVDRAGNRLTWDAHIGPLCERTLPLMLSMGEHMQVFWSMEMANLALALVDGGHLQKASKPYVGPHAAEFLKVNPRYQ